MICLYGKMVDDPQPRLVQNTNYATNGDYILHPSSCTVTEHAGGQYELELTHPIDATGVWAAIVEECVIKAPVPMPTYSQLNADGQTTTVTIGEAASAAQMVGIPDEQNTDKSDYPVYESVAVGDQFIIFDDSNLRESDILDTVNSLSLKAAYLTGHWEYFQQNPAHNASQNYYRVQSLRTGNTGYIPRSAIGSTTQRVYNLAEYGDIMSTDANGYRQYRSQLFRIYEVTTDPIKGQVTARARHIFYDCVGMLVGNYTPKPYTDETITETFTQVPGYQSVYNANQSVYNSFRNGIPVNVALATAKSIIMNDVNSYNRNRRMLCSFRNMNSVTIEADYSYKSLVEVLLDPDTGIVPKAQAKIIRDNMDTFVVENVTVNRGFEIAYGRNMTGAQWTRSTENVVTSVFPTGTDSDGNLIHLPYFVINAPTINDYPYIRLKRLEVSEVTSKDPGWEQKLIDAANAELAKGIYLADLTLKVTFAKLGDSEEYKQYRNLERLYLYDTVTVSHAPTGFKATMQVREYKWDCLRLRYESIELGDVFDPQGEKLAGYQLGDGAVSGAKLAAGSVGAANIVNNAITSGKIAALSIGNAHIQDASIGVGKIQNFEGEVANITTANINTANIETLTARVSDIIKAKIADADIEQAAVDRLNAGAASIVTAVINNADIDVASIAQLQSDEITAMQGFVDELRATIANAEEINAKVIAANTAWLATARIQSAHITDLSSRVAVIEDGRITNATIDTAKINNLNATIANLSQAEIGAASIDWAQLKTMVGDHAIIAEMVNDRMYISDLAVTDANMAHLTVGELVVKGTDGKFYSVTVNESGQITSTEKQVGYANIGADAIDSTKIIENSINADRLNVQQIFARDATVMNQIVANLNVDQLFAREGWISKLSTSLIQSGFREMLNLESDTGLILRVRSLTEDAVDENTELRLVITSTNDVMSTTAQSAILTAHVYKGNRDVTEDYDASCFEWHRNSGDESADEAWDSQTGHSGVKQITLAPGDIDRSATITCNLVTDEADGLLGTNELGDFVLG